MIEDKIIRGLWDMRPKGRKDERRYGSEIHESRGQEDRGGSSSLRTRSEVLRTKLEVAKVA
jgi:hypothetical protein